jgi:hypothetical protein
LVHHIWSRDLLLWRRWTRVVTHGVVIHGIIPVEELLLVLILVSSLMIEVVPMRTLVVTSIVHIPRLVLLLHHLMRHVSTIVHHIVWWALMSSSSH